MKIEQLHDAMRLALEKAGGKTPFAITGTRPTGRQADIIFRPDGVVAEVQLFKDTQTGVEQFMSTLYDTYNRWLFTYETPLVKGRGQIDAAALPPECADQIMRIVTQGLHAPLVTANKQIKQGRIDFQMRTAHGLLAYVMPLGVPIDPAIVLYGIQRVFAATPADWDHIDHILLATCRVEEIDPDHRAPYWAIIDRAGAEPLPEVFEERIRAAWFGVLSAHFGREIGYTEANTFTGFAA
ncbi:MAG: hypothetical protein AB7O49_13135 [Sphingomonadales bacterium]